MASYDEILAQVRESFSDAIALDKRLQAIYKRLDAGTATMQDALRFADAAGGHMGRILGRDVLSLRDSGGLTLDLLRAILPRAMWSNYDVVQDVAVRTQTAINEAAGMTMTAVKPEYNRNRAYGIADELINREVQEKTFIEQIRQASMAVVDDTVSSNADFQHEAGLEPEIHRSADSGACEWCRARTGVYKYGDIKGKHMDIFQRHTDCHCLITFVTNKGSQNVHTKRWYQDDNAAAIAARKERANQS